METDTLSRRKRTTVQPTGKDPQLNQGVIDLLEGLRRYHPLPPKLAFHFWSGGSYYPGFQSKLTDLTHERPGGEAPVIERTEHFNPQGVLNSEPLWYELSTRGKKIAESLAEQPLEIPERDHIKHRAFNACVGASFELLAPEHELRAVHLEEILSHARCPEMTRKARNPLGIPIGQRQVEADRLFGLKRENGYSFFAVEIDRATESNIRTVYAKLDNWIEVMQGRLFEPFYGLPNLRVLFITTAPGRMNTYIDYLKNKPKGDRFLFKALPDFGVHWKAPRGLLWELFTPWIATNGLKDICES
jgi:hypothetical protein